VVMPASASVRRFGFGSGLVMSDKLQFVVLHYS